jgi:hypothetical protein
LRHLRRLLPVIDAFPPPRNAVTGIDMPQQPVNALRQQLEQALAQLAGRTRIVVFGCARGADAAHWPASTPR